MEKPMKRLNHRARRRAFPADSLRGCPTVRCAHRRRWLWLRLAVAFGAGHVEDDLGRSVGIFLGIELAVDRGKSAEELVGDIGEDGGATGRDFVFREEEKKAGEEGVDGDGGTEFRKVGGEGRDRGLVLIFGEAGVAGAEGGVDIGGGEAAAPAIGEAIGATSGVIDKAGFNSLLSHFSFLCGWD
jgi:hypothetical protein